MNARSLFACAVLTVGCSQEQPKAQESAPVYMTAVQQRLAAAGQGLMACSVARRQSYAAAVSEIRIARQTQPEDDAACLAESMLLACLSEQAFLGLKEWQDATGNDCLTVRVALAQRVTVSDVKVETVGVK